MAEKDNEPSTLLCGGLAIIFGLIGFLMAIYDPDHGINMSVTGRYGAGEFGMTSLLLAFAGVVMLICGGISKIKQWHDARASEKKREIDMESDGNTNDEVLAEIANSNPDLTVRVNAVKMINDKDVLMRIIINSTSIPVCEAAVEKITDEYDLKDIAVSRLVYPSVRRKAVNKICDEHFLSDIIESDRDLSVREEARKRLIKVQQDNLGYGSKTCPNCKKSIPANAVACKYCYTLLYEK